MEPQFKISINPKLYIRDPDLSEIGKKIVKQGLELILKIGFEQFTFKKLAQDIGTTEATIYRYFENKHRLLTYLVNWYWTYLEFKIVFSINNLSDAGLKLKKTIELLSELQHSKKNGAFIDERSAYELVMLEGSKAYLTKHVNSDNKDQLFKPYKDLCARFSGLILEYNPRYKFPHSLASTVLEMAHSQHYFMKYLPSLTDFGKDKDSKKLRLFLETLLFDTLNAR
ncbi:MAG TPA: TetR/AcrR family transcriptional regulator [Bacteroidia bacterium]|nr:TetR/AcrR family transcriptional regulator [Bacteroidia bacterium]